MKHGKKYMETAKAVDRAKLYDPDEAIDVHPPVRLRSSW